MCRQIFVVVHLGVGDRKCVRVRNLFDAENGVEFGVVVGVGENLKLGVNVDAGLLLMP